MRFSPADLSRRIPDTGGADSTRLRTLAGWSIWRLVFLLVLTLVLFFLPLNVAAQQTTKRVLILTGSDPNFPGFSIITRNIVSSLRSGSRSRIEVIYELQQTLAEAPESPTRDDELAAYLKWKYADKKLDLVLAMVASRVRILLQKDPDLFGNVPKVFYEFDSEREATNRTLGPNITGVWASLDLHKTLDLALALHPNARKVVVVSGNGPEDNPKKERAQAEFRPYESRVEFSYLLADTIEDLRNQLAALDRKSVVIFLSFTRDKAGNRYSGPETMSLIAPTSGAPIYGYADTLLGLGITGGNLLDFEELGKRIGEMSQRVLNGERPEQIPQEMAPTVMTVDWRELQRWGISEQTLPPGSIVRFRQLSFWDLYKWYAIGAMAAVIIEALLIAWLLFLRVRRRQAEAEQLRLAQVAAAEHKRIGEIVSNVPGIVWEAMIDPVTQQRKTTFISDYLQEMLGYTPEEWLAAPGLGLRIMPEEDRERATHDTEAVLASGKKGIAQFRWQAEDGRIVWVETHLSPIVDGNEKVIGLRGVTLDITERKSAEETLRQTEEKDRAILRAIPDLMWLQTRDGVYLDYHAKDSRELLAPATEFLGKNMRDVLPAELAEEFLRCFERAEEMGEPQILEYQHNINERDQWFEARIVRSGDHILTLVRDITERVRAEAALRERKEELSEAQRVAKVGSWEWDPATDTVTWSEELYRITGRDPSLPPPNYESQSALFTAASWARLRAAVDQVLKHGTPYELELQLIRGDGRLLWTNARGEVLKDGTGRVVKLHGTLQDIAERKQAEADLQRAVMEVNRLRNQLQEENVYLREEINLEQNLGEMVGESAALRYVLFKIAEVAPTESTVLITGETGTGKELVARAIHNAGGRCDRPLVKVNCAALSPSLIESELFGHEKGAFTGASARKIGRFELADGATIFLDEIGELPIELQVKLLRVIQEGEFERLGSSKTIEADVRIIAATNRNLDLEVRKGVFREDLWYRLNVFPITVPPLRQRREDISLLVEHFASRFSKKLGKEITSVSPATLKSLRDYSWPGNVRELANVIERAVISSRGSTLVIGRDFTEPAADKLLQNNKTLEELERDYILRILNETGWRIEGQQGAARILGINPSTLRARIVKLGIQKPSPLEAAAS
jgi:formate hydrogenlyase transcriptional activator